MNYRFGRCFFDVGKSTLVRSVAYLMAFVLLFLHYSTVMVHAQETTIQETTTQEETDIYEATIGDATWTDGEEELPAELQSDEVEVVDLSEEPQSDEQRVDSLPEDISLQSSTMRVLSLSGGEKTAIINYMDSTMVGAPYNSTGGYTNTYSQGWCCAGAVSRVLYYAYDCKDIVKACTNPSLVSAVRDALVASGSFELVYNNASCFSGLGSAEVNEMYSSVTQAGDIIVFYGESEAHTPHCGIAGGGNVLYSALVHSGFSPTTIAYYACSGTQGAKAANGMAVYRKKTVLGKIRVCKTSFNPLITDGNSAYSFAGARYAISDSNAMDQNGVLKNIVSTVEIEDDKDNVSNYTSVSPGQYYIQEISAPSNGSYAINKTVYGPYEVTAGERTTVGIPNVDGLGQSDPGIYIQDAIWDQPVMYKGSLEIVKEDAEGVNHRGKPSLDGAEFTVKYYAGKYDSIDALAGITPSRTWVLRSKLQEDGRSYCALNSAYLQPGSSELYKVSENGDGSLPLGTLTVQETRAPEGYLLEDAYIYATDNAGGEKKNLYFTEIQPSGGTVKLVSGHQLTAKNQVIRGDIAFEKRNLDTDTPMCGVYFRLTSKTTGESHMLVTNQEGKASTAASFLPHTENTNGNDKEPDSLLEQTETDAVAEPTGIWFVGKADEPPEGVRDDLGALPYDTYILEELPCLANQGMQLLEPLEIHVNDNNRMAYEGVITNVPLAMIKTRAWDENTQDNYSIASEIVTLHDTVDYQWLKASERYTLKGVLMDLDTEQPIRDDRGCYVQEVMSFDVEALFGKNASEKCGSITMSYSFPGSNLAGKNTVFYEYLFPGEQLTPLIDENGEWHTEDAIAKHTDLTDERQQIHFADMKTDAFVGENKEKTGLIGDDNRIFDQVQYENLIPKKTYHLQAKLMYQDVKTEEIVPLSDQDGNEIVATQTFTTEDRNGTTMVEFTGLSKELLSTNQYVVYEYLFLDEALLLEESTFDNPRQTVSLQLPEEPVEVVKGASVEPREVQTVSAPKTGDNVRLKLVVTLGILSFGLFAILIIVRKR